MIVSLNDVRFSYGNRQVLKGVSLSIDKGEILGLVGPNGAGKSTMLNLIQGLLPNPGGITVFGGQPGNVTAKSRTGSMLQGNLLVRHVTVMEMVSLIAHQYDHSRDAAEVIASVGLGEQARQDLSSLSGGQLRKVTYACAIVHQPQLLFLDEPTAGMDASARRDFWTSIQALRANGMTIIITSHYLEEIQHVADRIAILKAGRLAYVGTWKDLQANKKNGTVTFSISASLPQASLVSLPAVANLEQQGNTVVLTSTDTDRTVEGLMTYLKGIHDLSIERQSLENVYLDMFANANDDDDGSDGSDGSDDGDAKSAINGSNAEGESK
jgi:ABC-2 type transport system ATP-binding protein